MTADHEDSEMAELAAWLNDHVHETPRHRRVQVRRLLERAERVILDSATVVPADD